MIKFFRKIRQKLLVENRFNKYLLYAIGEIVLVVIGILIALQINNWNLKKQDDIFEEKIIKELKTSITNDLEGFNQQLERVILKDKAIDTMLMVIDKSITISYKQLQKNQNKVGLGNLLSYDKAAFETLKNKGLQKIKSDTLKKKITQFYEVVLPKYHEFIDDNYNNYKSLSDKAWEKLKEIGFIKNYFELGEEGKGYYIKRKYDFSKINSQEYKDYLIIHAQYKRDDWFRMLAVIKKTKDILKLLNKEIETRFKNYS